MSDTVRIFFSGNQFRPSLPPGDYDAIETANGDFMVEDSKGRIWNLPAGSVQVLLTNKVTTDPEVQLLNE
jgi:hypothetical protein